MKIEIMILNKMIYVKDDKEKSRVAYIFTGTETMGNSDKFCGYSEQAMFFDDRRGFDRIPSEFIGKKCIAYAKDEANPRNPLSPRKVITTLEYNGKNIDLL